MLDVRAGRHQRLVPWAVDDDARDRQFVDMLRWYRRSGGIARDTEILACSRALGSRTWRSDRGSAKAISFEWNGSLWFPWFQFDRSDLSLKPAAAQVIDELGPVFDGWEMATWFAQPNLWLGGASPVDVLDRVLGDVLGAARADRFIAAG